MRVAIVNDLALAREVLRRLVLSVSGYTVAWTAADGAEAVDRAARDRPDVILMDLVMPVMDGVEATRRIMAGSPCPILLVTSSVSGNFNKVYEAMGHGGLDAVNTPTLGPDGQVRDSEGLLARLARLGRSRAGSPCRRWACQLRVPAGPTVRLQSLPWWRWVPPRGDRKPWPRFWVSSRLTYRPPSWWCSTSARSSSPAWPSGYRAHPAAGAVGC